MKDLRNRLKNAELLALLGAVVAGIGGAMFFYELLAPHRLLLLATGLVVHAAAMFYRRRLEQGSGDRHTQWESALYWSCWLLILALAAYLVLSGSQVAA